METKKIQKCILDIMKEIAYLCDKNKIPYYLVGGSMIGAIRHKGFIPWDDDIDIAIPRPYYSKFLEIASKELPSHLSAVSISNNPSYIYSFIKVEDKRTEIDFEWTRGSGLIERLFVDVFVLDGTPKNIYFRKFYCYYVQRLIAFKGALYMNSDQRPPFKRYLSKVLKYSLRIKKTALIDFINKQMFRYDFKNSDYVVNYNGVYGNKEITHIKIIGKPVLYQFEDTKFYGVEDFHNFLKNVYGDYMTLPPKEKQINHSIIAKFNY